MPSATLHPSDSRYIERHAAYYDKDLDDLDSLSAKWLAHREVVLGKRTARPKRERSLADVSLLVDTVIAETNLTDQTLADGMGVHRCTVEKMRNGTLGGRPSVAKLLWYIKQNDYFNSDTVKRVMAIMEGE